MSSYWLRRLVFAGLLLAAVFSARMASAGVASLQMLSAEQFSPSSAPALLGPITEAGRKGWACAPERAAGSTGSTQAELPTNQREP